MFYTINLGSLIKVFQSETKYSLKEIIDQHMYVYQKNFTNNDVMEFTHIPEQLITSNYISFKNENSIEENLKQLKHLSDIYNYFEINSNNETQSEKTTDISAYQPSDNVCTVSNVTELILDENKTIIDLMFNPTTMKVYYNDKDRINRNIISMEMFPELSYVGEYVFNMNLETLKEKLLNKFYYSVDQVKIEVNSLTLNDDEVLTYQKLVELFHQKFEFEDEHVYSLDDIIDTLSIKNDVKVVDFYKMCLKDFLDKNQIKILENGYMLKVKTQFKKIDVDEPIPTEEFNNLLQAQMKERSDNKVV